MTSTLVRSAAVRFKRKVPEFDRLAQRFPFVRRNLIVPPVQFQIEQGEGELSTYTFNTGVAQHYFCTVCGIKSFYVPRSNPDCISVNARCLDEGTVTGMTVELFDDAKREAEEAAKQR